jgi:predicted phosphoribosyltransferase
MKSFNNRREAGRALAAQLSEYTNRRDVTVFAVPRGGMPVAYEVARALSVPLDVFLVRKVYEHGCGAVQVGTITSGGFEIIDAHAIAAHGIDRRDAEREMALAREELVYQERVYRGAGRLSDVAGRTIILVYDGMATGASMVAAVAALRARGAARVVVATPVAAPNARAAVERVADACVCLMTPDPFYRIGIWYDDFAPVSDASVLILLDGAARERSAAAA